MIEVQDLTVTLGGRKVLDRFSLSGPEEGLTWLSGPSGEGKTTLLRVLAGLLEPDSGSFALPGRPVMLFQEDRLFPGLRVREQVEAVLPKGQKGRWEDYLRLAELWEDRDKTPRQLSGGMARRCALARALAVEGEVWLLDEPFAGVDLDRAERILERLRALKRPTLLTGHSPQLAALCDRAVEL